MNEQEAARQVVLAWHEAVNAGAIERVVALSCADIEVGGPRGSGRGIQLLEEVFRVQGSKIASVRRYPDLPTALAELETSS